MKTFTVLVREANGTGITYITSVSARTVESAKKKALKECSSEWGARDYPVKDLMVLGVIAGNVEILEWDDGYL